MFKRRRKAIPLEFLVVPAGGTLVLRAKDRLTPDEADRIKLAVATLRESNPSNSIVVVSEPDWEVAVIGAPV